MIRRMSPLAGLTGRNARTALAADGRHAQDDTQKDAATGNAPPAQITERQDTPKPEMEGGPSLPPKAPAQPERAYRITSPESGIEPADEPPSAAPAAPTAPTAGMPKRRSSRVKTTFLGFDRSDGRTEDILGNPANEKMATTAMFPVGWLVIVEGPGRGAGLSLHDGVCQIGRGDDQAVQLDFGDSSISRSNHAAIAFDEETRAFYLGYGGKSNIVRLNGKPVLATEILSHGDLVRIGETTLRFIAFCGQEFSWTDR